jgi:predicted RNase H-like HicB family nuclease
LVVTALMSIGKSGDPPAKANLIVLVMPAEDLPGQWIAHCLNLDLVTQGNSIEHALEMAGEAIQMVVADDLRDGLDPLERPLAPRECWDLLLEILNSPDGPLCR